MPGLESSARDSGAVVRNNFAFIDGDGSQTLSREELQTFIADTHRSEAARNAATDVLNHFDVVSGMATEKTPNTMRTYGASTTYATEFGDHTDSTAISKKDLELLQGNYTDDELKSLLSEAKTKNVQAGIFLIGMGACLTASGVALTAGFLGAAPVGWVAVPATALLAYGGVMSVGVGIDSLVNDESAQLTSQWTKRRDAIASWA